MFLKNIRVINNLTEKVYKLPQDRRQQIVNLNPHLCANMQTPASGMHLRESSDPVILSGLGFIPSHPLFQPPSSLSPFSHSRLSAVKLLSETNNYCMLISTKCQDQIMQLN